jgi:hypothetical protein
VGPLPDKARGRPAKNALHTTSTVATIPDLADIARLLELSDERDQWQCLRLAAFRDGWQAAEYAHADDYARGHADGFAARKAAMHDATAAAMDAHLAYLARWGPGGREHFADPRPGDYPGQGGVAA